MFLPAALSLKLRGNIDTPFILAAYVQWMSLVILFFAITYLHATKDYKIIAMFFLIGMGVTVVVAAAARFLLKTDEIHAIIYGLSLGFFVLAAGDFSYIKRYFRSPSQEY